MRRFFDYDFDGLELEIEVDFFEAVFSLSFIDLELSNLFAVPPGDQPLFADIDGTPSDDTLNGTEEADVISGFEGNDTINGLAGNDTLSGGDGDDIVNGGTGDDTIILSGNGEDVIDGGAGFDLVTFVNTNIGSLAFFSFTTGSPTLRIYTFDSGLHRHSLVNVERYEQRDSNTNDLQLLARQLTDGDDVLDISTEGVLGSATIYSGDGNDTITAGSGYDGSIGTLLTNGPANFLYGGAGNDIITGSLFRDFIEGGAGADTLVGVVFE